jgi:medium-chain acyl-[acyl-carrier-protein] hydrolase
MTVTNAPITDWVTFPHSVPGADLRLFCFPYAGGTALVYRTWPFGLPASVEVCAIQLPGHGNRLREPLIDRLPPLLSALMEQLAPYLDKPFAFFGHSMGALISFELARLLRREHQRGPEHLFVSGHRAPQKKREEKRTFELPQAEFIEELRRLNGTPREVFEHPELIDLMTPVLRADFAISQTYEYVDESPLDCAITAFGGLRDVDVTREHLEAWGTQTTGDFTVRMFPGDHFFLNSARASLLQTLSLELRRRSRD